MPMSDDMAGLAINAMQKSMDLSAELIKRVLNAGNVLVNALRNYMPKNEVLPTGDVSRNELLRTALTCNSKILTQSNFLSADAENIAKKAKQYGIAVSRVGSGAKVSLEYMERDKDVINQILQETVQERMQTGQQEIKQFKISESNIFAMQAELAKNDIDCCFIKASDGNYYCQYPAEKAEEVALVKQDFKAICKEVSFNCKFAKEKIFVGQETESPKEEAFVKFTDAKTQQTVLIKEDELTKERAINKMMEGFGYSRTEAELAANKLAQDLKVNPEQFLTHTDQLDALKSVRTNIKFDSDSILLRDTTFTLVDFNDSKNAHISVVCGDKYAVLVPAEQSAEQIKQICITELGMEPTKAADAAAKCVKIDEHIRGKKHESAIFRNTGEAQRVEIDRTSNTNFTIRVGATIKNYNLNDENLNQKIAKDFGVTESKAKDFVDKAKAQNAFMNNISRNAKSAKDKSKDLKRGSQDMARGTKR